MIKSKLEYKIKLLSGNNVVMVEAKGHEAEIFVPQILNGRISFQNIIPKRRCCNMGNNGSVTKHIKKERSGGDIAADDRNPLISTNSRPWRVYGGNDTRIPPPIVTSTPTPARPAGKENIENDRRAEAFSKNTHQLTGKAPQTPPTPEPVRNVTKMVPATSPGIKVIPIFREQTPNTPKNVGRIVHNNKNIISMNNTSIATNGGSNNNDTSKIGDVPSFNSSLNGSKHHECSSNSIAAFRILSTPGTANEKKKGKGSQRTPGTVTKWRKCITPLRTYSRRQLLQKASKSNTKKPLFNNSAARIKMKAVPHYMVNPTQAVGSKFVVEVKKRKLTVDAKTAISPRTFKRQQVETEDLKNDSEYKLPKNRQEYEMVKRSAAFDLLTNSNRCDKMSPKLNEQFRKSCVNKKSSTVPKYKKFCDLPPLELGDKERLQEIPKNIPKSTFQIVRQVN